MPTAFIFHGTAGYPEENWFPWLKHELDKLGFSVIVPQFPTPENQTLENWFKVFERHKREYSPETILVGHSLGGAFLLRVLEKGSIRIRAAFLVAAPIGVLPIKNYDGDRLFLAKPFDWEKINRSAGKFIVFHSDNDPYVSLGNGKELAKRLGTTLAVVPGAGHFNTASGYKEFPLLLEKMKEAVND
ncbi:MAG: alpha/beta hydrolase [Candidatus Anstonellaceae archaeon]